MLSKSTYDKLTDRGADRHITMNFELAITDLRIVFIVHLSVMADKESRLRLFSTNQIEEPKFTSKLDV